MTAHTNGAEMEKNGNGGTEERGREVALMEREIPVER